MIERAAGHRAPKVELAPKQVTCQKLPFDVPEAEEELETIEVRVEAGSEDETEAIADDVIGGVAIRGAFDVAT